MFRSVLAATALLVAGPVAAGTLDAQSRVDRVTVYPDGAAVVRLVPFTLPAGETTLLARDFPPSLDPRSVRVEGSTSEGIAVLGVAARKLQVEDRPPGADALKARFDTLKLERDNLGSHIDALTARKAFAERFAKEVPLGPGKSEQRAPVAEWRSTFAAVAEEIEAVGRELVTAHSEADKLDRQLARLEEEMRAKPATRMEVRIDVSAERAATGTLAIRYTVRNARWTSLYDARLLAGAAGAKPSLELVRRAEITQTSGEAWNNVALTVSTLRTAGGTQAPETQPLIVRYAPPPRPPVPVRVGGAMERDSALRSKAAAPALAAPALPVAEPEAEADDSGLQLVWEVPGRVDIDSGSTRILRLATLKVEPDLAVKVAAATDTAPYLEATFKQPDEAPLLEGRVALYRDGVYVGQGQVQTVTRDEPVTLGFGRDERVKVTRTMLRRLESQSGIVSPVKSERQEMKITVRNSRDIPMRIRVEDRIPQSETQDIQVEMLPGGMAPTAKDVDDKRGVLAWSYDYAPGEVREIRFGWRVRWPADRRIVTVPGN